MAGQLRPETMKTLSRHVAYLAGYFHRSQYLRKLYTFFNDYKKYSHACLSPQATWIESRPTLSKRTPLR